MGSSIRLEISSRGPFAAGQPFGEVGAYEWLSGRVHFAIDPEHPANAPVVDLARAPRTATGLVEYAADLYILAPADRARGNGGILYDVNNRGDLRALQFFNDAAHSNTPRMAAHAGNGFLMRRGYTVVWSGWQGDLLPGDGRQTMTLPEATDAGRPLTGLTRAELIVDRPGVDTLPLSGNGYTHSYPAVPEFQQQAVLSRREYESDPRQVVPRADWQFARPGADGAPAPSATHLHLPEGFRPGWIYELVYTTHNPPVLGLGFTGVRDLLAFLRHAEVDAAGAPNPLRAGGGRIDRVYGWGRSQSGRFLRGLVYEGFNVDERGRPVFDAIWPHVAGAGRVWLNARFAQPGRFPRHHADRLYPSDQFPFAYAATRDPYRGRTDAITRRPESDPLVLHTQTSAEYWSRRGSLVHTDSAGNDLPETERARVYLFAGSQHRAYPNGQPETGPHQHLSNPLDTAPLLRALLDTLDAWARHGTPPPASRVPRRADGTLVPAAEVGASFPAIPGVQPPAEANRLFVQDHGPDAERGFFTVEPPREDRQREYAVLVPAVDADGNETSGIRMPALAAALATYTGWNFRPRGSAERAPAGITGSYLPFAATAAEREHRGDPRPSLAERYRSAAAYQQAFAQAAAELVRARLLLPEDVERLHQRASADGAAIRSRVAPGT